MEKENQKNQKKVASKIIEVHPEVKEIVIREGKAIPIANPKDVLITGSITAPSTFIKERNFDFEKNKTHVLIDKERGTISLVLNEDAPFNSYSVDGEIRIGNKFKSLGINVDISYAPEELAKKLKLLRSIFDSKAEHASIVNSLRNIKAKLKQDIDAKDDSRGNQSMNFTQVLDSNIPDKFSLTLPLIEGEEPKKFDVNVFIEGNSYNELKCYLESIDAADMIENSFKEILDREVLILKDYAVVMEK